MSDWQAVANKIAPDIPADQIERISPLLDSMRALYLVQTARLTPAIEPSYTQMMMEEPAE